MTPTARGCMMEAASNEAAFFCSSPGHQFDYEALPVEVPAAAKRITGEASSVAR